jgi:glycosyltransferase involved in cell wall biosynthesis
MSHTSVSVALCTYNGARFLQEQLESLASQTRLPDELIVCDDCSSDATPAILAEYAQTAPFPVRLQRNSRQLGPAQNFAGAIGGCAGDLIALCDQDDVWSPNKLQRFVETFAESPDAIYAFSDASVIDDTGAESGMNLWQMVGLQDRIAHFTGSHQMAILLRHNLIPGATMVFRSEHRALILPIPQHWMHDYWIALLGSTLGFGIPIAEPLLHYRRHSAQTCGWRKQSWLQVAHASLRTDPAECWEKVEIFRALIERLASKATDNHRFPERHTAIRDKYLHLIVRAQIRSGRGMIKIRQLVTEIASGRYFRYSDSWQSIIRDF